MVDERSAECDFGLWIWDGSGGGGGGVGREILLRGGPMGLAMDMRRP